MGLENSPVDWSEAMYKSALTLQENGAEELKNEVELLFMPSVFLLQFLDLVRLYISKVPISKQPPVAGFEAGMTYPLADNTHWDTKALIPFTRS
jgi:hypothetical protein